jgi:hypothetical protein
MILSTLPGSVALGCSGVRVISSFSCAIFADFAMRGRAISITKLGVSHSRVVFHVSYAPWTYYGLQIEIAQFSSAQFGYPDG